LEKTGYLGPKGTFTQQAAAILAPQTEFVPLRDIKEIFDTVDNGLCNIGIAPIENSTGGSVNATLDALLASSVLITELLVMPICHAIMSNSAAPQKVLAHPQALAQCREYLRENFANIPQITCSSNGEAAAIASKDSTVAAIAPIYAAKEYSLNILGKNIQDSAVNSTSFIKVEKEEKSTKNDNTTSKTQNYRTTIAFSTENRPGSLCKILGIFDHYHINMSKILSRPNPARLGEYIFFVDIENYNALDAKKSLNKIKHADNITMYKFLGEYPTKNP